METTNSNSRTLILGAVAGIVVAGAIGAAFMLGGQTGGSDAAPEGRPSVQNSATASAPGQTNDASAANAPQGGQQASQSTGGLPATDGSQSEGDGGQPVEPVVSQTPVPEVEDEEAPTDTPTATPTSTPWGPDDVATEPTATPTADPCPLCNDFEIAMPIDTVPVISNISTSFCYPNLVMLFDLAFADVVWFTYTVSGVTHHSTHIDAATFIGFLSEDVSSLGWGAVLIDNIRIHATDDNGDHTVSDEIARPEMEFC